jgi:hypothetical protein
MPPGDMRCMTKKEGARIEPGDVLARTRASSKVPPGVQSQIAGTIRSISR